LKILESPRAGELTVGHIAEMLLADVACGMYECTRYNVEERPDD